MVEFEITELHRRLANLILLGKVVEADYTQTIPKLRIKVGALQTAWLPMLTPRAGPDSSWWPLEVGEQVVVLSPSGELTQGVVLGAINQIAFPSVGNHADSHKQVYADGAVIEYHRKTHHLSAILPPGATTTLVSDGGVNITGDVMVTGSITASKEIMDKTRSMQADRNLYNAHTHSGVSTGPGTTAIPNQSQ